MKIVLLLAVLFLPRGVIDDKVERTFQWAQFTYDYSNHEWCVDAQRRDADPGEMVGGCWPTLKEAEKGILNERTVDSN